MKYRYWRATLVRRGVSTNRAISRKGPTPMLCFWRKTYCIATSELVPYGDPVGTAGWDASETVLGRLRNARYVRFRNPAQRAHTARGSSTIPVCGFLLSPSSRMRCFPPRNRSRQSFFVCSAIALAHLKRPAWAAAVPNAIGHTTCGTPGGWDADGA